MAYELRYDLLIRTDDDGSLFVEVPDLPGCFASGDTEDELLVSLGEAVAMYLGYPAERVTAAWTYSAAERRLLVCG